MKNKKLLSILLSFLMIITMFPVSVYAEDDFSNSNDDTNETSEYIDNSDLSDEDIIEPDEIETEERKPRALMKAPLRGNDNVDELEIRTFIVQFFYGATLNDNNDYVWTAPSSASGHRFSYRINYAISGKFELEPESIEMRIPKQILRDRDGGFADYYEMSIPTKKEVDDGEEIDMDINYAYYEEGDEIVIYNFREVYTGENGYIELSYLTSKSTFNYVDYDGDEETTEDRSYDFFATIKVTGNGKTVEEESDHFNVYIDTNATIQSTDKRFPTKYNEWQSEWGNEPTWEDGSDGYYYLLWEIRSVINVHTQPYNFSIEDTLITEPGDFVAYRFSGQSTFTSLNYVENQTLSGYRYDYVLTRHPKSYWDTLDHWEITNSEIATVDPIDQVDSDTTAKSQKTFVWNKPAYYKPLGRVEMHKRADGWYRTVSGNQNIIPLTNLGHVSAEYSRYDLDKLKEGQVDYLDKLDYAVWADGYTYPWTLSGDDQGDSPDEYGKKSVRFELIDDKFYLLSEDEAVNLVNVIDTTLGRHQLTSEDFQIDYINWRVWYKSGSFSNGWVEEKEDPYNDDNVHFYVKKGSHTQDWIEVAEACLGPRFEDYYNLDPDIVKSFDKDTISFYDDVVAYRIVTDSRHYYTEIDAVPYTRLKGSDYVLDFLQTNEAVGLYNEAYANFYEFNESASEYTLFHQEDAEADVDYLRGSTRNSLIDKRISATSNNTRTRRYSINWYIAMDEEYTTGTGERSPVVQRSGTFYDLLPAGSILIVDSVAIKKENGFISDTDYSFEVIENYNNTGRDMLIVTINVPADKYALFYETSHPWDSIKDWGHYIYNPVAYRTGNEDISDFNTGERGPDRAKDNFTDFIDDENKFIYAEYNYDISILTAAAANLHKKVKDSTDEDYSYDTWTTINGNYSYRWRYQNTYNTKAKDLVFFDTMENYPVYDESTGETKYSDWHGTFDSIDVTQLQSKGVAPVVYYSTIENLDVDIDENHDLTNTSVWQLLTDTTDPSTIKALAVDARKKELGEDFILSEGDSVSVIVHMKAPSNGVGGFEPGTYPESYNNIYLENTTIDETGGSAHFYIHQDYTTIRLIIVGDVRIKKVNEEDNTQTIPKIKFRLFGKSAYGTEIDLINITDRNGNLIFKNVEMGEYILQEYEANDDWLEDHTEYHVKIDENGIVTIDGNPVIAGQPLIITNKPRIHGDLSIQKRREGTGDEEIALIREIKSKNNGDKVRIDDTDYVIISKDSVGAKLSREHSILVNGDSFNDLLNWYSYPNKLEYVVMGYSKDYPEIVNGSYTTVDVSLNKDRSILAYIAGNYLYVLSENVIEFNPDSSYMFAGFGRLRTSWTSKPTSELISITFDNNIDTSKVENMKSMFVSIGYAEINGLTHFDTSNVTNMQWMFGEFMGESLDLSSFDTHNVTNMDNMFYCYDIEIGHSELKNIYASDFWTVENLGPLTPHGYGDGYGSLMFYNQEKLPNYDFSHCSMESANFDEYGYLTYKEYTKPELLAGEIWVSLEEKPESPIADTTFKLSGTSDYGNEIVQIQTSDVSGRLKFTNIEKGIYELREIKPNDDYVLNETVWTVVVDEAGNVAILEPTDEDLRDRLYQVRENGLSYNLYNEPRYWGFTLRKVDKENPTIWLQGATFTLTGVSDLGTEYNETAISSENGRVVFDHIERGTYILEEIKAPTGVDETGKEGGNRNYLPDPVKYIVSINYKGDVTINGLSLNEHGDYVVKNDRLYDGKITVIKKWDDGKTGTDAENRPTPVVHLTTYEPEELKRYVVRYDGNGGLFGTSSTNSLMYMPDTKRKKGDDISNDKLIEGEYLIPAKDKNSFDGWYYDKECTIPFDNTFNGNPTVVYAKWKPSVAYAVFDSTDNSLTFFRDEPDKYNNGQVDGTKTYYANFEDVEEFLYDSSVPWSSKNKLIKNVIFEDKIKPICTSNWFSNTYNFRGFTNPENFDVSDVINMHHMFYFAARDTQEDFYLDLSSWDTGKVKDMQSMFSLSGLKADKWTVKGIENWDTSSVENMASMFSYCASKVDVFNIDLSKWETGKVTDMQSMFSWTAENATTWSIGDIGKWDVSSVETMRTMFYSTAKKATNLTLDLSGWNTQSLSDTGYMFYGAGEDSTNIDLNVSGWDMRNATELSYTFANIGKNKSNKIKINVSNWNTSNIKTYSSTFYSVGSNYTQTLEITGLQTWNVSSATSMNSTFSSMIGTNSMVANLDLSTWNMSSITNLTCMFSHCKNANLTINITKMPISYSDMFYGAAEADNAKITVKYISPVTSSDINILINTKTANSKVVNGGEGQLPTVSNNNNNLLISNSKKKSIFEELGLINRIHADEGDVVESGTKGGVTYEIIDNGDGTYTCNVGSAKKEYLDSVENAPWKNSAYIKSIRSLNVLGEIVLPEDSSYLFAELGNGWTVHNFTINNADKFVTNNVTKFDYAFQNTGNVVNTVNLDLSGWDVSNCVSFRDMFDHACAYSHNITIDVSGWKFSLDENVDIYAGGMFKYIGLEEVESFSLIGLDTWKTKRFENTNSMFYNILGNSSCAFVIDLSSWDTSNIVNMNSMFKYAASLASKWSIGNISNWDTKNLTQAVSMFEYAAQKANTTIDLSGWNTSELTNVKAMFDGFGCGNNVETTIDLSGWNTSKVYDMRSMFIESGVDKLVLSPKMLGDNNQRFKLTYLDGNDWVHVRDVNGNYTFDETTYTSLELVNLNEETDPTLSGTWIRRSSPLYEKELENIEYISEQGINKDNHWYKIADDTWVYTFDVFDDTVPYYVWEEFIEGYSSETMYPMYDLFNENEEKTYTITNKAPKDSGKLEIKKTVEGIETDIKFDFKITLTGEEISGTQIFGGVAFNDGVAYIKLAHNETKVIEDIPWNTTYTVEETPVAHYLIEKEGDTGTITKDGDEITNGLAIFNNTYVPPIIEPVNITIKKQITGNSVSDDEFTIDVVFSKLDHNTTYYLSNDESFVSDDKGNGYVQIKISADEEISINNLPVGSTYTVAEAAGDYIASFEIIDKNGVSNIVKTKNNNTSDNNELSTSEETADEGEDVLITFTNEINKYQDLSLKKKVVSNSSNNKEFNFSIELFNLSPNTRYDSSIGRLTSDSDGYIQKDVVLKDNEVIEFYKLPVGSSYSIKEDDYSKHGFAVEITSDNEKDTISGNNITGTIMNELDNSITYKNIEKTVVTGTKTWLDDAVLHDNVSEVKLILKRTIEGSDQYEILNNVPVWERNTYHFTDLDIEDDEGNKYVYEVEEERIDGYTSERENPEDNVFNFTNIKDKGEFTVTKTVTGKKIDINKSFKFTITLRNSDGELLSGVFSDIEFVDGVATIELKHDESITIETYAGVSYEVQEQDYRKEKYRTYYENNKGVISKEKTIICKYVNVLEDEEKPPYTPPKTGK